MSKRKVVGIDLGTTFSAMITFIGAAPAIVMGHWHLAETQFAYLFVPLIIGIIVLVLGFTVMKWLLQMQRLKPRPTPGSSPVATATVTERIVAPHAEPVESTTPLPTVAPTATETVAPTIAPTVAPPSAPAPSSAEPEVRRAEPVNPKDAAQIPTPSPTPKRSPRPPRPTPSPRASATATVRPR